MCAHPACINAWGRHYNIQAVAFDLNIAFLLATLAPLLEVAKRACRGPHVATTATLETAKAFAPLKGLDEHPVPLPLQPDTRCMVLMRTPARKCMWPRACFAFMFAHCRRIACVGVEPASDADSPRASRVIHALFVLDQVSLSQHVAVVDSADVAEDVAPVAPVAPARVASCWREEAEPSAQHPSSSHDPADGQRRARPPSSGDSHAEILSVEAQL